MPHHPAQRDERHSSLLSDSDGSAHEGADTGQAGVGGQLVAQLVPETTLAYLKSPESAEVRAKIAATDDVVHY